MALRLLLGIVGLMSVLGIWQHWFRIENLRTERGIDALSVIGRANIRADVGGIFLVIGLFALLATWQKDGRWSLAAAITVGAALLGRFVSLLIDGTDGPVFLPIAIEAIVAALFVAAWWLWRKAPEGL